MTGYWHYLRGIALVTGWVVAVLAFLLAALGLLGLGPLA